MTAKVRTDTLTTETLAAMSPREIDALCAERVMGFVRRSFPLADRLWRFVRPDEAERYGMVEPWEMAQPSSNWISSVPPYSTSHDACAELLARVAEMGENVQGCFELRLRHLMRKGIGTPTYAFDLIIAPPRQKCEAALLAVQEMGR